MTELKGNGQFKYVNDKSTRDLLINAFTAITLVEGWEFMKEDINSYMFSDHSKMIEIREQMWNLPNGNLHSGASFGCIMREMQLLAKFGEIEHKKKYFN